MGLGLVPRGQTMCFGSLQSKCVSRDRLESEFRHWVSRETDAQKGIWLISKGKEGKEERWGKARRTEEREKEGRERERERNRVFKCPM